MPRRPVRIVHQADGDRQERQFRSLKAARLFVRARLGPLPERCDPLGILLGDDGEAIIPVTCTIDELLEG